MAIVLLCVLLVGLVAGTSIDPRRRIQQDKYGYSSYGHGSVTDYRAIQNRLSRLESKIEGVEADYGYGNVFAIHLQSTTSPACPIGTFKLWVGYSLVKAFDGSGFIDLSDPGSCMQQFDPVPNVLCRGRKCKLNGKNWKSTWLWNRDEENVMASRCSVCESAKSLLVVHSQNQTKPTCPEGYTSQYFWSGYSFISTGQSGKISLSSVGSCLPFFEPSPFIECNSRTCKKIKVSNVWLSVAGMTQEEKETVNSKNAWQMISRCRVCALYTPTLWPRNRRVIEHDPGRGVNVYN